MEVYGLDNWGLKQGYRNSGNAFVVLMGCLRKHLNVSENKRVVCLLKFGRCINLCCGVQVDKIAQFVQLFLDAKFGSLEGGINLEFNAL